MKYKKNIYDVDKIITRRIIGKKHFYLIKWKGYPISDCSWEPISHLYNIIDMVKEFNDNFPYSIEQESLKQFYIEMKKYNQKLKKKEKKKGINRTMKSNKIIIPIEDIDINIDIDYSVKNEEKQDEEKSKIEGTNIISDNKVKNINENEININRNIITKENINENNEQKLIWPIIIW